MALPVPLPVPLPALVVPPIWPSHSSYERLLADSADTAETLGKIHEVRWHTLKKSYLKEQES